MALKQYNPTSPGRRAMTTPTFEEITRKGPEKSLVVANTPTGGRNNRGKITVRHHGSGHKRAYRLIDFKRDKWSIPARVAAIEYDPNRSARIALLHYSDGEKRYILAPDGLGVGDRLMAGAEAEIRAGNALPLTRSAGCAAQLMAKEEDYVQIRLMSGEVRRVHADCMATIGQVGNLDHENMTIGKAGRSRWLGRRPHVRGVAMNPVDHPHGGGEGKSGQGNPHPVSPWGQLAKGYKTRRRKDTGKFIIKRRE